MGVGGGVGLGLDAELLASAPPGWALTDWLEAVSLSARSGSAAGWPDEHPAAKRPAAIRAETYRRMRPLNHRPAGSAPMSRAAWRLHALPCSRSGWRV